MSEVQKAFELCVFAALHNPADSHAKEVVNAVVKGMAHGLTCPYVPSPCGKHLVNLFFVIMERRLPVSLFVKVLEAVFRGKECYGALVQVLSKETHPTHGQNKMTVVVMASLAIDGQGKAYLPALQNFLLRKMSSC